VNPHDLNEVFEAMGSRCDPATSLDINRRIWSSRVDPRLEPEKVGISSELRKAMIEKWRDLLDGEK